jgi:hypothetical protein
VLAFSKLAAVPAVNFEQTDLREVLVEVVDGREGALKQ